MDKPITPIPAPTNIMIGYCPNCGLNPVYESDRIRIESLSSNDRCPIGPLQLHNWSNSNICIHCGKDSRNNNIDIYRCINCKQEFNGSEAIPF